MRSAVSIAAVVAVTPADEVIGHVLGTRGQVRVLSGYQPRLHGMFTYPESFDRT